MLSLDIGTILVLHQSSLLVGAASLILLWFRADRPRGVVDIASGFTLLSCGALLAGLHLLDAVRFEDLTGVGMPLSLAGFLFLLQGIVQLDAPASHIRPLFLLALAFLTFGFASGLFDDVRMRSLTFHGGGAALLFASGLSIARRRALEPLPSRLPLALCLFAGSFTYGLQLPSLLFGWTSPISMATGFAITLPINYGVAAFVSSLVRERTELHHRHVAVTDSLTGAANRRGFFDLVPPMPSAGDSLAVLDLDRFKRLNDQFGHAAGDHALVAFAALVERRLGRGDIFARFGGEEFVVFVPGPQAGRAVRLVEELRAAIEAEEIVWRGLRLPVTVSIGLSVAGSGPTDWTTLTEGADRALYTAKEAGRNRISIDLGIASGGIDEVPPVRMPQADRTARVQSNAA